MGQMHLLNGTGHSTLEWDVAAPETLTIAEEEFTRMEKLGYHAFLRDHPESEAQRLDSFDPLANEILWLRPLQGG